MYAFKSLTVLALATGATARWCGGDKQCHPINCTVTIKQPFFDINHDENKQWLLNTVQTSLLSTDLASQNHVALWTGVNAPDHAHEGHWFTVGFLRVKPGQKYPTGNPGFTLPIPYVAQTSLEWCKRGDKGVCC